uniref:Uncharacterized protein n=1 Tax=Chenopodium quinoa TaxID=63459 RepID=A0A803MM96_CHEQI
MPHRPCSHHQPRTAPVCTTSYTPSLFAPSATSHRPCSHHQLRCTAPVRTTSYVAPPLFAPPATSHLPRRTTTYVAPPSSYLSRSHRPYDALFCFKETPDAIRVVKETFHEFCHLSGEAIYMQKSSILFSPNTPARFVRILCQPLAVKSKKILGTYLPNGCRWKNFVQTLACSRENSKDNLFMEILSSLDGWEEHPNQWCACCFIEAYTLNELVSQITVKCDYVPTSKILMGKFECFQTHLLDNKGPHMHSQSS